MLSSLISPSLIYSISISQSLSLYGQTDFIWEVRDFDNEKVPTEYTVGGEVISNSQVILGLLWNPFPLTLEISGRYNLDKQKFTIRDSFISYYGFNWSHFLGKQQAAWGLGSFFHPLFFLDFIENDQLEISVTPETLRIWQGDFTYLWRNQTIHLKGFVENGWIEEGFIGNPSWYSFLLLYESYLESFSVNGQVGYMNKENISYFEGGAETYYQMNDLWGISLSGAIEYPIKENKDPHYRFLVGLEAHSIDNTIFGKAEAWYDQNRWFLGASCSWSPSFTKASFTISNIYEIDSPGYQLFLNLSYPLNSHLSLSFQNIFTGGEEGSLYDSELPYIGQLSFKVEF